MKGTCLLSFSGGLDSVAAIGVLKTWGYDITLGHITWLIQGTRFGEEQTKAAHRLAGELSLPIIILARMMFPEYSYAKYSWVPACISTILHHAGDPCEYPADSVRRYDAVAFGTDFLDTGLSDNSVRMGWLKAMQDYTYDGEVLFPLDGMTRPERKAIVPPALLEMTVSCYLGQDGEPCGTCWKCLE